MTAETMPTLLDQDATYSVDGYDGIAWHYIKDETEPDDDTEWSGIENATGRVVMVMVGDDRRFTFEPDECTALADDAFCHECGQLGCTADAR